MILLLSCEHFGNKIPEEFAYLFAPDRGVLQTHRAYDLGAESLFKELIPLSKKHFHYPYSRLFIELNRSLHHPKLFSEFTKPLTKEKKEVLANSYYLPYRNKVEMEIAQLIKQHGEVLHLSVHSFTPVLNGKIRNAHIGLLYDPKRSSEKVFAKQFKIEIQKENPQLHVRFNYPYLGTADGFTTYLRKQFPIGYSGIELEVKNDKITKKLNTQVFNSILHLVSTSEI